ncbi:hypothetical protein HY029_05670 [Candidatus Gottesmanbacteria bacterium]|nr:hypothetical protein [Candidatus Gottesmanbacteria bacterium]
MENWPGTNIACIENFNGVKVPTIKCFEAIFQRLLKIILPLAVIALFVMLVIGGFKYLTSAGDQKKTASAQQTMTYAIGGIALMAIAYLVFKIIYAFTGVNVLEFTIPNSTNTP